MNALLRGLAVACLSLAAPGAPAGAQSCRLALVLALDVSSSISQEEYSLQRVGLARALMAPEVVQLFLSGPSVAVFVFEWAGPGTQVPLLPGWQVVSDMSDLQRIEAALMSAHHITGRQPVGMTAVGSALLFANRAMSTAPGCSGQTIDVSGDGPNNVGFAPRDVYANYPFGGIIVNALVIEARSAETEGGLGRWFASNVLHGPGAFWLPADGYEDFQRAMTLKLTRELEGPQMGGMTLQGPG